MDEIKELPGDPGGTYLIASDGVRTEVVDSGFVPDWATSFWYLKDDPRQRPDWNRVNGYSYTAPNKLSKSDS